jgi:hypothetical protein
MTHSGDRDSHTIMERLHDIPALEAVLKRAARDAIRQHALIGNPIAIWKGDKLVVEVPKLEDYPLEDDAP